MQMNTSITYPYTSGISAILAMLSNAHRSIMVKVAN
jgi:hypothetical protein